MARIYENILQCVGATPLVRLNHVTRGLDAEVAAKCEFLNPGGSVKDRIGVFMLEEAERKGEIRPGDTLIEATSGNTGIGIAMAAAVKGYRCIITMPEKMSREKQVVLEAFGAEIHRTPTEAAFDSPESHIGVAKSLNRHIPRSRILDQYKNNDNPRVHSERTAMEILEDTDGKIDAFVATVGTGGTMSGVAKVLKEQVPNCRIVGVDPWGSIISGRKDDYVGTYKVEGIGYDFVPDVMWRDLVDDWVKTNDRDSFLMARKLIRREGLLVGGSSGSAAWAAIEWARKHGRKGMRVVTILPDGVRNYMTKFLDETWMRENRFTEEPWAEGEISDIVRRMPPRKVLTVRENQPVGAAVGLMKQHGISQVPVVGEDGTLAGILTETDVLTALFDDRCTMDTVSAEVMCRRVSTVNVADPATKLAETFLRGETALVLDDGGKLLTLLSMLDLIEFLAGGKATKPASTT